MQGQHSMNKKQKTVYLSKLGNQHKALRHEGETGEMHVLVLTVASTSTHTHTAMRLRCETAHLLRLHLNI